MTFPRRAYAACLAAYAAANAPRYALRALHGRTVPFLPRLFPAREDGLAHEKTPRAKTILHACSVGEVEAARVLYEALAGRSDFAPLLVTTITDTGLAAARRAKLPAAYLPFDFEGALRSGLDAHPLEKFVIVETEIWPNLLLELARRKVPVFLVSGRISDRAYRRYQKIKRYLAPVLETLAAVGAQTGEDADRFLALGSPPSRTQVTGNLKADLAAQPPPDWPIPGRNTPALLVAGSTHAEEEAALLAALRAVREEVAEARLLLAPRHLERADAVLKSARKAGFSARLKSHAAADRTVWKADVVVLDTHGELASAYGLSPLAFVGGTISPVGGHNPMEAARQGALVLHGPHTQNARAAYDALSAAGARLVADGTSIAAVWKEMLDDPGACHAAGRSLKEAAARESGALERTLELLCGASPASSLSS